MVPFCCGIRFVEIGNGEPELLSRFSLVASCSHWPCKALENEVLPTLPRCVFVLRMSLIISLNQELIS